MDSSQDNPVITALRTRRSVRAYGAEPVSRQELETIVDCGRLAPSSKNRQRWEFVVATDRERLRCLAELTDHGKFIAAAAACIVVCGDRDHRSVYLDCAAATENMLIAIHALGLAGCWVQAFDKPYDREIRQLFDIPDRLVLVALVALGRPGKEGASPGKESGRSGKEGASPGKRPLSEVLHWERF